MATPWWAKVTPNYYDKPSNLSAEVDKRSRHYAAVLADTHLADEPQVAAAFLNADVPYSVAQRVNRQYQVIKNQAATNALTTGGVPNQATAQQKASGPPATPPPAPGDYWSLDPNNIWDAFVKTNNQIYDSYNSWAASVPGVPTADSALEGLKDIPKRIMTIPNMAYSAIASPLGQTLANVQQPADPNKISQGVEQAWGGGPLGGLLGSLAKTTLPVGVAAASNITGTALAPAQRSDMQRAGYDPDSWASRYAWYYDSMDAGQRAVSESDIRALSQEYDPEKVQAAREVITSNFLNDGKPEALTPSTQAFIKGIQEGTADPRDSELFDRLNHAAGTRPGGVISEALGQDVGSEAAQVTAALGDLAFYWFADPYAAGAKILYAGRLNRSVSAGSMAAMENKIVALKDPTVLHSEPATILGKNMDELTNSVDQVHTILNQASKLTDNATKAAALNAAGKVFEQFSIKHPDMVDHWAFVAQYRAGKVQFIKPKTGPELAAEVAKIEKGQKGDLYYVKVNDKPTVPGYVLDRTSPESLQQSLNETRADLTSRMSEWMFLHAALGQGRPIVKGMVLMPGEVAVNARVRAAIAPIRNRLAGSEGRILKYLNDPANNAPVVHFNGQLDTMGNMFLGKADGQWIKQNYTQKWAATFEKMAANIGMTYSGRAIKFDSPSSLEAIKRLGLGHLPRRMAQIVAINYARGTPAERFMMTKQLFSTMADAANLKNTPLANQVYEVLTKGNSTSKAGRVGTMDPASVYVANRADNEIAVGEDKIAAGVWDYQMADHMVAPNFRMIRALQQRTGLLSAVTGLFNARILNGPTAVWKVGKVGNPANMGRQAIEAYALLLADQGFGAFMGAVNARRAVANATVGERLEANVLTKAANNISKATQGKPQVLADLNRTARSGNTVAYRDMLARIATDAGFAPSQVHALATLAEGVKVEDLMRLGGWGKTAVAMGGILTPLRRLRLTAADQAARVVPGLRAPKDVPITAEWHQYLDQSYIDALMRFALGEFGHAADNALSLVGGSVAQEIAAGAKLGVPARPAALPNARGWLGTAGDSGAQNWFKELDSRQTDLVGHDVLRAVAIEARNKSGATVAQVLNHGRTSQLIPAHLNTAEDVARWIVQTGDSGAGLRAAASRLAYDPHGARIDTINSGAAWDDAVDRLVQVQLRDAAEHLGAKVDPSTGSFRWDPSYNPMLDKLGYGKRVTLSDLSAIGDKVRPAELSASIYVPDFQTFSKTNIVDWASKLYSFTVARPLQRLAINPVFIANKNIAYRDMGPLAEEFITRGYAPKDAAALLEQSASNYALAATFRYTDNVKERSFFSEITENFLMFQRASEDFLRRFTRVASASPTLLSKAYLLMEAANHSGLIYPGPPEDDEGDGQDPKRHLMFTFPGSALMAKTIQEVGQGLGWGDTSLITTPLFSSMTSQVRYVNPSLSNPFGFSTTPMIGMPLRVLRQIFPETDSEITNTLGRLEGGGERFFAEQGIMQSLMPTPIARLIPALTQDEVDGQLASSIRNAFVYFGAAGKVPDDDATSEEKEEAHEAIKDMAINQLVWRAAVGTFSPWAPQYNAPQGLGMPEVNVIDQARGINNIRSEWFDVVRQASEKVGPEAALGEASKEWLLRHTPGLSILHPTAFATGTTDNPGNAGEAPNAASGPALTEWMVANKGWLKDNQSVAYYLLPNYLEAQYTAQGMRDQLRNQVRVHRDGADFYAEMRYQVAMKQYWDQVNRKSALIASGQNKRLVNSQFSQWEDDWKTAHPATSEEKTKREDPGYVKGTLAPALQKLVADNRAPAGVNLDAAKQVWEHYQKYEEIYNKTQPGAKGADQRRTLNEQYREVGDKRFLNTPAHDLWKAMDIYENGY